MLEREGSRRQRPCQARPTNVPIAGTFPEQFGKHTAYGVNCGPECTGVALAVEVEVEVVEVVVVWYRVSPVVIGLFYEKCELH